MQPLPPEPNRRSGERTKAPVEKLDADLYEDLLNRYERVLVFAGQIQEKLRQQALLVERTEVQEREIDRLKRLLALEESYNRLLEKALARLGVFPEEEPEDTGLST